MKVASSKINKQNHTAYVPSAIREALKVAGGDSLEWHIINDNVIVKRSLGDCKRCGVNEADPENSEDLCSKCFQER